MKRILPAFALCLFASASVAAECIAIDRLPITISDPGSYCLVKSFELNSPSGTVIAIDSNDVSLDFAGNTIRNVYGHETNANGVVALNHWNIEVTGGTVAGFRTGIFLGTSSGTCSRTQGVWYRVERMNVQDSGATGIAMVGCNLMARKNWVAFVGKYGVGSGKGMYLNGTQFSVLDNDVQHVAGDGRLNTGIEIGGVTGVVEGNRIVATQHGLVMRDSVDTVYRDNTTTEIQGDRYRGGNDAGGNF